MKRLYSLNAIPKDEILLPGFDMIGNFKALFSTPVQMQGGIFLLCMRGHCKLKIHLNDFSMKADSIAVIFPNQYFQVIEADRECRFAFVAFSPSLAQHPALFTKTIQYAPSIFEQPVLELIPGMVEVFIDYFKLLVKAKHLPFLPEEQAHLACLQLIIGIGTIAQKNVPTRQPQYSRSEEIVKDLIRIIVENYKKERNIAFYAEKVHLSPQHLCTTIKKATGKTLTDIISSFVIRDAQAKLRSTDLSIQEIAYSLNFSDTSFFGKYFKRYTGMSPKQYRNM